MKIIFATQNQGKIKEMKAILSDLKIDVLSAREFGITEEPIEDGKTFEENALIKARFIAQKTNEYSVADDSGLCIKALNGAPGVHTARWAGSRPASSAVGENDHDKILVEYTLEKMKAVPSDKRQAYFESAVALVSPDGKEWTFSGQVHGSISFESRGIALPRLPYDSIFTPEGFMKTFAEMSGEEKNQISHRGSAFEKLKEQIKKIIGYSEH